MSDQKKITKSKKQVKSQRLDLKSSWGIELEAAICDHCDWSYLLPPDDSQLTCPHCFRGKLERIGDGLPYSHPPELAVPFSASTDLLQRSMQEFARSVPFAPRDLTPLNLSARLQRILLPMWLVDTDVSASWQSEVGFDYDVVSHQDRFSDRRGGWSSERVTETRIRWEPRMGKLQRKYENVPAPALEEHSKIAAWLGEHELASAGGYDASIIKDAHVRLPTRAPEDAWPDAVPTLRALAAEDCRQAAGAKHQRDFHWSPEYSKRNWTQVLLPVYATHYLDDEAAPQALIIHGQTGKISGARRASMKRARMTSLVMAAVASMLGFPSLLFSVLPILPNEIRSVAGCALALAFLMGILAIIPIAVAWQFNRRRSAAA